MDEGDPISYEVLGEGVPVHAAGGEQVGTVLAVLAAPEEDIFHGIVVAVPHQGSHVVLAEDVAAIHERQVDLKIAADAVAALPPPDGSAPVFDEDPGELMGWQHWVHKLTRRGDWKRER
jgi:hypothetical protein